MWLGISTRSEHDNEKDVISHNKFLYLIATDLCDKESISSTL